MQSSCKEIQCICEWKKIIKYSLFLRQCNVYQPAQSKKEEDKIQVRQTQTFKNLLFLNKTHSSPKKIQVAYATIDLSWMPIVSITFSVMTILVSFMKTATHIFQDHPWYLRVVIFLSIFIFRMVTWVCLVIILVELIFIPIGILGITNAAIMLTVQKNNIILEPVSHALQALVFPFTKMIPNDQEKENAKNIFIAQTVFGNLLLAIVLTVTFILCSVDIYNPWKANLKYPILISKAWFNVIFWSMLPMFVAATLPLPILLKFNQ